MRNVPRVGEGHRDMLFRGLKCLFRTEAPVTAPPVEKAKVCTQAVLSFVHEHFLPGRGTNSYHRKSMRYTKAVFELSGL